MRAVRYPSVGATPEVVEVLRPEPGPGEVLLQVTAAGLCHSDIAVMSFDEEQLDEQLGGASPPLILGHEAAGTVAAVGDGVRTVLEGQDVVVYGPWGCGDCLMCAQGKENYCLRAAELRIHPPGLGAPGALAEYLLVDDPRHLVPLHGLDPVATVPLTDAGLTPYHAIKRSLHRLTPGSTAVVIGAGGLGHLAIQLLRALSPARVIALDVTEEKLDLARRVGAHEALPSDEKSAQAIKEMTGGRGAQGVFDFVGAPATVSVAGAAAAVESDIAIVGLAGGALPVGFGVTPFDATVTAPYWGSRAELIEVLELARAGAIEVHTETYGLDETPAVYQRLHEGRVNGRAVILPGGPPS